MTEAESMSVSAADAAATKEEADVTSVEQVGDDMFDFHFNLSLS